MEDGRKEIFQVLSSPFLVTIYNRLSGTIFLKNILEEVRNKEDVLLAYFCEVRYTFFISRFLKSYKNLCQYLLASIFFAEIPALLSLYN